tara:strand:- start:20 stop:733 length:714 start_codon:yes stop_codon:yes gene_type:complete
LTKDLLKRILATVYLLIFFIIVIFIFFNKDLFLNLNFENIKYNYEKLRTILDNNKFISISLYLFSSTIWICFVGIVSPLLLVSTLLFDYFGMLLSIFSFILGSVLTFSIANLFKDYLKKVLVKSNKLPDFNEKSIFLFTIFRLVPGMPFVIKNIFAIFFNLSYKQFIFATILAEVPQVILYTYIFKKAIDTSKVYASELKLAVLTEDLFLPSILLLIFFILLFILKIKFSKYFRQMS